MAYLIDGHNLIPKIPGMSLDSIDDEEELVALLQEFCRQRRKHAEVFFDNAPAGFKSLLRSGWVTAHYVRRGQTADEGIRLRLNRLGKSASNWTVVTSDRQVQVNARALHAQVMTSDDFANLLEQVLRGKGDASAANRSLSPEEVQAWIDLFRSRKL